MKPKLGICPNCGESLGDLENICNIYECPNCGWRIERIYHEVAFELLEYERRENEYLNKQFPDKRINKMREIEETAIKRRILKLKADPNCNYCNGEGYETIYSDGKASAFPCNKCTGLSSIDEKYQFYIY